MDSKLDEILALLKEQNELLQKLSLGTGDSSVKEEIKEYLLKNCNISWLNDTIEGEVYDVLLDAIWYIIFKK